MKKLFLAILFLSSLSYAQIPQDILIAESRPDKHQYFTPLSLGSKLEFWFDNNDATKITLSSGAVTSQTDQTGNYTRSPSGAGNPPYNSILTINNEKGNILFNGATGLKLSGSGHFNHTQGELFVVFRRYTNSTVGMTNNSFFMGNTQAAGANNYIMFQDFSNNSSFGNSIGAQFNITGTLNQIYSNTKSVSDKKTIANFRSDGTQYFFGHDSNLARSFTVPSGSNNGVWLSALNSLADNISFGYRIISSATSYSTHYEYEIIYCNTMLTTTERSLVLAYLNAKHDCYRSNTINYGVVLFGSSNTGGQSTLIPNRLKITHPHSYIRTGTNTFAQLLFGTNNEGDGGSAANYGAEMAFVPALSEYLDNTDVYLEKYGVGGSRFCVIDGSNPATGSTNTWNTGVSDLWPTLQTTTGELQTKLNALGGTNRSICITESGENDTFYTADANVFSTNFSSVLTGLQAILTNLNYFGINKIKSSLAGTGSPGRNIDAINIVQAAQESKVSSIGSNAALIDMYNYTATPGGVHYQDVQQLYIGRDAFESIRPKL